MPVDIAGKDISVGDIVVCTQPGAGRALPGLVLGEVISFTKHTIKVIYVNKDYDRLQTEEMVEDTANPPRWISSSGTPYWHLVGTGIFHDIEPVNIKYFSDRFLIVRPI